jgi:hypothetical protein
MINMPSAQPAEQIYYLETLMEETKPVQDDVATPGDATNIKCTNYCGFSVTGTPDYCREMYAEHEHESEEESWEETPTMWQGYVFSPYGVIIFVMVSFVLVSIINKVGLWR